MWYRRLSVLRYCLIASLTAAEPFRGSSFSPISKSLRFKKVTKKSGNRIVVYGFVFNNREFVLCFPIFTVGLILNFRYQFSVSQKIPLPSESSLSILFSVLIKSMSTPRNSVKNITRCTTFTGVFNISFFLCCKSDSVK